MYLPGNVTLEIGPDIQGMDIDPHGVTVNDEGTIVVAGGCTYRCLLFETDTFRYHSHRVTF